MKLSEHYILVTSMEIFFFVDRYVKHIQPTAVNDIIRLQTNFYMTNYNLSLTSSIV